MSATRGLVKPRCGSTSSRSQRLSSIWQKCWQSLFARMVPKATRRGLLNGYSPKQTILFSLSVRGESLRMLRCGFGGTSSPEFSASPESASARLTRFVFSVRTFRRGAEIGHELNVRVLRSVSILGTKRGSPNQRGASGKNGLPACHFVTVNVMSAGVCSSPSCARHRTTYVPGSVNVVRSIHLLSFGTGGSV